MSPFLTAFIVIFAAQALRYVIFAGGLFIISQRHSPVFIASRRIAKKVTTTAQARREVGFSLLSMLLFGLLVAGLSFLKASAIFEAPKPVALGRAVLWVPVLLVLQDTYFYFTHRAMHHPKLFKHMHLVHHRSLDPSPLAAFAFHPSEALVDAVFGVVVAATLAPPMAALIVFQLIGFFINLYGHFGAELLPPSFRKSWAFGVLNTTTHHHQHHNTTNSNFGLYFQLWDRLLGTNHPRYADTFTQNASRGTAAASHRGDARRASWR